MTCNKMAVAVDSIQQEWSSLFPDFTTLTGSRLFIKKLMAVSLSALTYIRGIFPERAYGNRHLSGIKLKILSEDSNIEAVNKFINLIRSCFDAVDNKYLQQLSVGICTDAEKKDEVVEYYNLCFKYREDEYSVECNNEKSPKITEDEPTVSATLWLLQSIVNMNDILGSLPKKAYLTMKLLYDEEITPPDYEPPGFEPSDCAKYCIASNAIKFELGKVATNIHGYKMYLKTTLSKEPLMQCLEESVIMDSQGSGKEILGSQDKNINGIQRTKSDSERVVEDGPVRCICECKSDSGTQFLHCAICMKRQHSVCYGYLKPEQFPSSFYCIKCINDAPFNESQLDMVYEYEGLERRDFCALRRAIVFCAASKYMTLIQMEKHLGCSKQVAKLLTETMEFEGFIRKGVKGRYIVNGNTLLCKGYQEYFPANENKENAGENELLKVRTTKQRSQDIKSNRSLKRKGIETDSSEEFQSQPKKKKGSSRVKEAIKIMD